MFKPNIPKYACINCITKKVTRSQLLEFVILIKIGTSSSDFFTAMAVLVSIGFTIISLRIWFKGMCVCVCVKEPTWLCSCSLKVGLHVTAEPILCELRTLLVRSKVKVSIVYPNLWLVIMLLHIVNCLQCKLSPWCGMPVHDLCIVKLLQSKHAKVNQVHIILTFKCLSIFGVLSLMSPCGIVWLYRLYMYVPMFPDGLGADGTVTGQDCAVPSNMFVLCV